MKTASHLWASWTVIAIIIFNTVGVPLPAVSSSLPVQDPSPSFYADHTSAADRLFTKPTSAAQEFSLRGERQSKQFFLARVSFLATPHHHREHHLWQLSEPGSFSFQLFFPQKIAPPSSATDPFLS